MREFACKILQLCSVGVVLLNSASLAFDIDAYTSKYCLPAIKQVVRLLFFCLFFDSEQLSVSILHFHFDKPVTWLSKKWIVVYLASFSAVFHSWFFSLSWYYWFPSTLAKAFQFDRAALKTTAKHRCARHSNETDQYLILKTLRKTSSLHSIS